MEERQLANTAKRSTIEYSKGPCIYVTYTLHIRYNNT